MEKKLTEEEILDKGYRKYTGDIIDVYFNKEVCTHSGNCVHGDPKTFDLSRKPWILTDDNRTDKIIKVIEKCPSGALKYKVKEDEFIRP